MEVIEDGNIMDRIPILLQRDLEYYQQHQTLLSESICRGVVGGRLDFPRSASFASAKIVLWLEDEFAVAFKQGSGMFVTTEEDTNDAGGVAKTSDPDKFVQLAVKSSDELLEHLHMLAQEALDHADLPVLTATLGAAALIKNSLFCYLQHVEDLGNSERQAILQSCYKRYVSMAEAVAERVLDLHSRVLALYVLQGGAAGSEQRGAGAPAVHGWWLYMNGSRRDLWDTVPPRMAQRIFAGMLNETLTILTVRYCQTIPSEESLPLLINDIVNILLCTSQLLPCICAGGEELCGSRRRAGSRAVRDVHAKCDALYASLLFRGAQLHCVQQALKEAQEPNESDSPSQWFTFVNPRLFTGVSDDIKSTLELPVTCAVGLELIVLLAQPQPSWTLLVKVLMMRNCHLSRMLLIHCIRHMSTDNGVWAANGLWYGGGGKCSGFLCTADGFCRFKQDSVVAEEEYARTAGALTYILASIGSKDEFKSTLCYALEVTGRDWSACLDKQQVWCDRRPPWLAGLLALAGTSLQFLPSILVKAVQTGASMYQTMSLCLTCISRTLDCIPRALINACAVIEKILPLNISPVGGSVLLQMLITVAYEETLTWAKKEADRENATPIEANGEAHNMNTAKKIKHVRIVSRGNTTTSSVSFDGSHSSAASIALAIAEALCSIDSDYKHTQQIEMLIEQVQNVNGTSGHPSLEQFPDLATFFEEALALTTIAMRNQIYYLSTAHPVHSQGLRIRRPAASAASRQSAHSSDAERRCTRSQCRKSE